MARAAVACDGHRHDADGTGARDEHILADDVERQRRVRGIAERIQDGGDFIVDGVRQLEDIAGRNGQIFGKGAGPVHAHARSVPAQVPPARPAITAVPAGNVALSGHAVTGVEAAHFHAQFDDFAGILVTHGHGHGHGFLRPGIPVVDVHVGAADGRSMHFDEYVVVADGRLRDVLQPDAGFRACLDQCFHQILRIMPKSRPARLNA